MQLESADIPPNNTLYVRNLNEKVKIDELKSSLYQLFSQFGAVLEVKCQKTYKLRGQAWVVFEDLGAATKARADMNGFVFFNKPMVILFAKDQSDIIAKRDGTFKPREKRVREDQKALVPKHLQNKKPKLEDKKAIMPPDQHMSQAPNQMSQYPPRQEPEDPPNKVLFVQGLPDGTTESDLSALFQQYPGFKEVRLVQGHPGISFVEFEDDYRSGQAMAALQNFRITATNFLKITYAKRGG